MLIHGTLTEVLQDQHHTCQQFEQQIEGTGVSTEDLKILCPPKLAPNGSVGGVYCGIISTAMTLSGAFELNPNEANSASTLVVVKLVSPNAPVPNVRGLSW